MHNIEHTKLNIRNMYMNEQAINIGTFGSWPKMDQNTIWEPRLQQTSMGIMLIGSREFPNVALSKLIFPNLA